jgi:acetyl-CoA acyltransferase
MTKLQNDAVFVSACRTPIGKFRGALSSCRPDDLLALAFREALTRSGLAENHVSEAIAGCANQAGEDNRNVARMALLLAGLPQKIPATTVNRLCASGLEAIVQGARAIRTQDSQVVLVGGVESMSRAPWIMGKPEVAYPSGTPDIFDSTLGWRFPNPKIAALFPLESMGETAENIAEKFKITRQEQDEFALRSHQKATAAWLERQFDQEIIKVPIPQKKGPDLIVETDEGPRPDTTLAKLNVLTPAFRKNGSVTAGNSSTLNDGAAALVITSREFAHAHGLTIMASFRAVGAAGVDPRIMGIGPVPATKIALQRAGISIADLDVVELNEAFASQSIAVIKELQFNHERINQRGGAIALGHPLGCSGARLMTTLLHILKDQQKTFALVTLCVGVGQGLSVIVENE